MKIAFNEEKLTNVYTISFLKQQYMALMDNKFSANNVSASSLFSHYFKYYFPNKTELAQLFTKSYKIELYIINHTLYNRL